MTGSAQHIAGHSVYILDSDGSAIGSERDATDLISEAAGTDAQMIAIPTARLDPGFLDLSTRMAGLFVEKLQTYGWRLAFLGDISDHLNRSGALTDWVREVNKGRSPWFVADRSELSAKLEAEG
ncbi:DUF4180 domain-containing protein [uncultured Parasphingopyxis sp.]|uniref:DUF4180 domain-containing protein n=1 Tax=uncultured Parasphingopyxis sp. TaxID=1547918 RepID=UPI00262E0DAB|nr:DUF4180 domain-containing protein [uncultured Parasphingopyxis sp.]